MTVKLQLHGGASSASSLTVSDKAFGRDFNESLVHQAVIAWLAGGRAGTKAQKTRAQVRGGGAKPWRQKGTGRARAGTIRSPLWTGGGKVFAATPRDYSQKLNRKMYRGALASIFSELARQDRLLVLEEFGVDAPKTKQLASKLKDLGLDSVLIVTQGVDEKLYLAARNLPRVAVCDASRVNPVSLIGYEKILVTVPALRHIEEWLS